MTVNEIQSEDWSDVLLDLLKFTFNFIYITIREWVLSVWPKDRKDIIDEVVLITGGGHGMGRQVAINLAKLGAKIVLWDINEKSVRNVCEEITKMGGKAYWYICDVTSESNVKRTAEAVENDVGAVTILINNAGIMQNRPMMELDSVRIKQTMEINVLSHFWTIRTFLPSMEKNNRGHIVAIASGAGLVGHINQVDYSASKHAVVGLMEALMAELRQKNSNIKMTTVCPLTVATGMNQYPTTKCNWLMPIITTEDAANQIVDAIRREEFLVTIPRSLLTGIKLIRVLPRAVLCYVMDFSGYCKVPNTDTSTLPPMNNEQFT